MKSYRTHFIVLGLYAGLTLLLTYPWVTQFNSGFLGSATWAFDESTFVWNIWRFKHNLLNLQQSPLYTDQIFYPLGISLVLYTYNFLNALLGLPILVAAGLPLAANVTILLAYVLSGYGTYLLLRYLFAAKNPHVAEVAAFIGGAIYAFLASRAIFAALGHYDIVSTGFIPFFTLFFLKTLRQPDWKNPVLAGLFAALNLLAEMIFGVFLLFLGLLLLLFHLKPAKAGQTLASYWSGLLLRLLVLAVTAGLLWLPVMVPILQAFFTDDFALTGWGESLKLSADLIGWFTPTDLHPLWGSDWVTRLRAVQAGTAPFSDVNTVFLGYGILAFALLGVVIYRRRVAMWATAAFVFAVFTLGPLLQIGGRYLFPLDNLLREQGIAQDITFPLPFALLHYLPVINANRVPARFSVTLGLALAVLAAYGLYWLLAKVSQNGQATRRLWGVGGLLLIAVLFDQLAWPMPTTSAVVPTVYQEIAAEPGEFSLLQLPLGWRNSFGVYGAERTQIQYYQHIHQKPMIGGNISRAPAFKFDYYKQIPLFQAIAQTELPQRDPPVSPETLAQAKIQAGELMTLYNVGYVVVHQPISMRKPYEDTFTTTRALIFDVLPLDETPAFESPEATAYRVLQPPVPNPLRIEFGDWRGNPYRGAGWAGDEFYQGAGINWSTAPQAEVFFPVRGDGDRGLIFHFSPFQYDGAPPQHLDIYLNEVSIADDYPVSPGWQVADLTLPAEHLVEGLNRLRLEPAQQPVPRNVLPSQTTIGETGIQTPVDLELNSHADFSYVTVGFGDDAVDASAHRRGINVAVLDPLDGTVLDVRGFDTAANQYEDAALRDYLATIPQGHIVLISSQGADAANFLSIDFSGLGASPGVPAMPYSLIGVQGASPGTALQASGEAYLRLGGNPDTRPLGIAVDWLEIGE